MVSARRLQDLLGGVTLPLAYHPLLSISESVLVLLMVSGEQATIQVMQAMILE